MVQVMEERGRSVPAWFNEEPALLPGDEFYMDSFWELSTCREVGMGMGPIPWDKIIMYSSYFQLEPDIRNVFVLTIRAMDTVYLKWHDDKREADKSNKKPKRRSR